MSASYFINSEERSKKISQAMLGNKNFLGKKHSEETKRKISEAKKGRTISQEHKDKISRTLKEKNILPPIGWNKGLKHSDETKKKMSKTHKRIGSGKRSKGKRWTEEQRRKLRTVRKSGAENPNWNGGKPRRGRDGTKEYDSFEYRLWRDKVFQRDDYTCQECDTRGCVLNAHHIYPWVFFPELRYEIDNGISLCTECHLAEHKRIKLEDNNFEHN